MNSNSNDTLLLFSLGPVQSFIAEARRTHDLWAGSKILVDVTRAAIAAIDPAGENLVFPAHVEAHEQKSIPNVFALLVPFADAEQLAHAARKAAQKKLREIAEEALKRLSGVSPDEAFNNIWDRQLQRHLEFNWVAVQQTADEKNHGKLYERARKALEARKHTRNFSEAEEPGMKDSLSGQRSALFTASFPNPKKFWEAVQKQLDNKSILQAKGRERLDTIGLAKRFSIWPQEMDYFPSVSSVASALFLQQAKEKAPGALAEFEQALDELAKQKIIFALPNFNKALAALPDWHHDGFYFYEERLRDEVVKYEMGETPSPAQQLALRVARTKLENLRKQAGTHLSSYYAILMMDGDSMGRRVSDCEKIEQHRQLSEKMEDFARFVTKLKPAGSAVIYAGGDDVMMLLPLRHALAVARELRDEYMALFNKWASEAFGAEKAKATPFTCSAGLVIAHHLSPLDAVLQETRAAEKRAKNLYDRDALAITVLKRSGEPVQVGAKWEVGSEKTVELILDFVQLFEKKENGLAAKFPYDAAQEAGALMEIDNKAHEALLRRLLKRHGPKINDLETRAKRLANLSQGLPGGPVELANWLLLARFIAQGGND
jgi:CRISPR-associated protein Cmr2